MKSVFMMKLRFYSLPHCPRTCGKLGWSYETLESTAPIILQCGHTHSLGQPILRCDTCSRKAGRTIVICAKCHVRCPMCGNPSAWFIVVPAKMVSGIAVSGVRGGTEILCQGTSQTYLIDACCSSQITGFTKSICRNVSDASCQIHGEFFPVSWPSIGMVVIMPNREPTLAQRLKMVADLRLIARERFGLGDEHLVMRHLQRLEIYWEQSLLEQVQTCLKRLRQSVQKSSVSAIVFRPTTLFGQ